ncbi:MAG: FAD-dependent oxidoreductase, partial [Acidimicrobiia bacterium]
MNASGRQVTLDVAGMTCASCEGHVVAALTTAGASEATADHRRGIARFAWSASVTEDELRAAVTAVGYTPGALTVDEPSAAFMAADDVDYDLLIVGSGGAAFAAAIRATSYGARVAVVERGEVGGTCVNVGCVPSKTLLAAAGAYHSAAHHPFAGVPTTAGPVDFGALIAQKDELVAGLRQAKYLDLADVYDFDIIHGDAQFTGPDTIDMDGRTLRASSYLVATGAEPAVPDLPGLTEAGYLTSTTAMDLPDLPRRLVVIGGGFVGMEQAQLFARLGSDVHLVGHVAPRAEPELAEWMRRILADVGFDIHDARAVSVERTAAGVTVSCDD